MTRELISPEQSQMLVMCAAILASVLGGVLGFWFKRVPGLVAILSGPLIYALWLMHGALVARFGMDSLALLVGETIVFIVLGAVLGLGWNRLGARNTEN